MKIQACGMTHPGCARPNNEDAVALPGLVMVDQSENSVHVSPTKRPALFAVIDGLGGHRCGEEASRLVAHSLLELAQKIHSVRDLEVGLESINQRLFSEMGMDERRRGYGAVAAGVVFDVDSAFIFNLGDARVYEYSNGYAVLMSSDQRIPGSNAVTQSFGGREEYKAIIPKITEHTIDGSLRFLICSDGLWESVDLPSLEKCLAIEELRSAAEQLMDEALKANASDNVSLVVIDIEVGLFAGESFMTIS